MQAAAPAAWPARAGNTGNAAAARPATWAQSGATGTTQTAPGIAASVARNTSSACTAAPPSHQSGEARVEQRERRDEERHDRNRNDVGEESDDRHLLEEDEGERRETERRDHLGAQIDAHPGERPQSGVDSAARSLGCARFSPRASAIATTGAKRLCFFCAWFSAISASLCTRKGLSNRSRNSTR